MLEALNKSVAADPKYEKPLTLRANLNYKLQNWEDSLNDFKNL